MTVETREPQGTPNRIAVGRWLFWIVLAFIGFVTLSPIDLRPETPLPPFVERFAAYLIVSLLCMTGYPAIRLRCFAGLAIAAASLEAGQLLIPGRDARFIDFAVKFAGILVGTSVAFAIDRVRSSRRDRSGGSTTR